jgi:hypothetical protein
MFTDDIAVIREALEAVADATKLLGLDPDIRPALAALERVEQEVKRKDGALHVIQVTTKKPMPADDRLASIHNTAWAALASPKGETDE